MVRARSIQKKSLSHGISYFSGLQCAKFPWDLPNTCPHSTSLSVTTNCFFQFAAKKTSLAKCKIKASALSLIFESHPSIHI